MANTSYFFRTSESQVGFAKAAGGSRVSGLGTGGLSVTLSVKANHDGLRALKGFSDKPETVLQAIAFAGAQRLAGELIKAMASPKSGVFWPWLPNRSSAPGEFPAIQSGDLVNSIRVFTSKSKAKQGLAHVGIGAGLPRSYAFYLEYGTMYMAPRPLARRAAVQFKGETIQAMRDAWAAGRNWQAASAGKPAPAKILGPW